MVEGPVNEGTPMIIIREFTWVVSSPRRLHCFQCQAVNSEYNAGYSAYS